MPITSTCVASSSSIGSSLASVKRCVCGRIVAYDRMGPSGRAEDDAVASITILTNRSAVSVRSTAPARMAAVSSSGEHAGKVCAAVGSQRCWLTTVVLVSSSARGFDGSLMLMPTVTLCRQRSSCAGTAPPLRASLAATAVTSASAGSLSASAVGEHLGPAAKTCAAMSTVSGEGQMRTSAMEPAKPAPRASVRGLPPRSRTEEPSALGTSGSPGAARGTHSVQLATTMSSTVSVPEAALSSASS
mmetsp:Transcript_13058/g.34044  ORF Transcript_13058/g.34044 Transcript_13058/m.34044 type:complete len:245 (-) Transcript_13058:456-1190(-)